jgi:hypothetical protein
MGGGGEIILFETLSTLVATLPTLPATLVTSLQRAYYGVSGWGANLITSLITSLITYILLHVIRKVITYSLRFITY